MLHLDLFSGIGGFAYAVDQVWDNTTHIFCDNDKFCQAVLKKHWPGSLIYNGIRDITDTEYKRWGRLGNQSGQRNEDKTRGQNKRIDLLTGGFPCQPFSAAGVRRGTADERYLWPEMLRVIRLSKPQWVIAENVRGLLTWEGGVVFEQICVDLESEGYEVWPFIIPAIAVNAPHRRDRIWWVARHAKHARPDGTQDRKGNPQRSHSNSEGQDKVRQPKGANSLWPSATNTTSQRLRGNSSGEKSQPKTPRTQNGVDKENWDKDWLEVATELCGVDARISDWMDGYIRRMIRLDDGVSPNKRTTEELQTLWQAFHTPKIWQQARRLFPMAEKEVLFSVLWELLEAVRQSARLPRASQKTSEEPVRKLWDSLEIDYPSQERQHNQQRAKELSNLVPKLSYETALVFTQAWHHFQRSYSHLYSGEVKLGDTTLSKAKHRAEQLKAYGNAIVPQVAIEIMKSIKLSNGTHP